MTFGEKRQKPLGPASRSDEGWSVRNVYKNRGRYRECDSYFWLSISHDKKAYDKPKAKKVLFYTDCN